MLTKDDLKEKPKRFVYCYGTGCEKAAKCLRRMALDFVEPETICFEVFNPLCVCSNGVCGKYLSDEPVEVKYGVKKLYGKLPHNNAMAIKGALLKVFGRSEYYRKFRHEHPFTPHDQRLVKRLFEEHGINEEPEYEYSKMKIEW